MRQRIFGLSSYFLRRLVTSLAGIIYVILALLFWVLLFPPGQGTPDLDYYILVIGAFGAGMSFLSTLTVAARANRAANFPLVVRLPSRIEYLSAVLISSVAYAVLLQALVAALALFRGPDWVAARIAEIPPMWLAVDIFACVLAMHASDFVTSNWSRVYIYGVLAILLFGHGAGNSVGMWLANRLSGLGRSLIGAGLFKLGGTAQDVGLWMSDKGSAALSRIFGIAFWPFRSLADAVVAGHFEPAQALAPAIIMLYATILFMFAADLFATKDLEFTE